jgi:selenide,water dikinase
MEAFSILPDPQTNGGLLVAVDPNSVDEVKELFRQNGLEKFATPVGRFIAKDEKIIHVLE